MDIKQQVHIETNPRIDYDRHNHNNTDRIVIVCIVVPSIGMVDVMKTRKVFAILPEDKAWEFKERVIEQKIPGGINGVLKPFILDWLQKHPRRPDIKKSSAD